MMRVWISLVLCAAAGFAGVEAPGSAVDQELIAAMWRGNAAEIRGLLDRGANPDARSDQGDTPLMMVAIYHNNTDDMVVELVQLLLARKADPNAASPSGNTPLAAMIRYKRVPAARALIRAGAKVDFVPPGGDSMSQRTPLMDACEAEYEPGVDLLLEEGADPAAGTRRGTALDITLGRNAALTRKLIAKGGKRLAGSLKRAAEVGDVEAVKLLFAAGAPPVDGMLLEAARNGHAGVIGALRDAKVDLDEAGDRGAALVAALQTDHPDFARRLIEAGIDLEDRYSGNWRGLHVAAAKNDLETVKLMLARKVRLDWADGHESKTPLIEAAAAGHVEVVRALLDAGAKVDLANDPGSPGCVAPPWSGTPRAWAEKNKHADVVKLLTERGAK